MTVPTDRPALESVASAAACDWPTTSGTVTVAGPLETSTTTWLPSCVSVPAGGFVPITRPAATVLLFCERVVGLKPALRSLSRRLRGGQAFDVGQRGARGAAGDDDRDVRAAVDDGAGPRRLADHDARRHDRAGGERGHGREPGVAERGSGHLFALAGHVRHGHASGRREQQDQRDGDERLLRARPRAPT